MFEMNLNFQKFYQWDQKHYIFTSLQTNSMADRLDHTMYFASSISKQPFVKGTGKKICVKRFAKSLRYTDVFLLPTNDYYFVNELSGCGFKSRCSHLNLRFLACFVQGVPWHSGNYRVWIHSEACTWRDKNIQLYIANCKV